MTAITHERLLEVVNYCPETGEFTPRIRRGPTSAGRQLGHVEKNGYRRLMIDGKRYLAHRLAWFYMTGSWPAVDVDHRNLSRDDNTWRNLRLATDCQNHANRGLSRSNTSGLKGACWNRFRGHWQSYIKVEGRSHFLGRFETKEEAHAAYSAAAARFHGEFARAA